MLKDNPNLVVLMFFKDPNKEVYAVVTKDDLGLMLENEKPIILKNSDFAKSDCIDNNPIFTKDYKLNELGRAIQISMKEDPDQFYKKPSEKYRSKEKF